RIPPLNLIPALLHPPDLWPPIVMRIRPIQAQDGSPMATMVAGDLRAVAPHHGINVPPGLEDSGMHRPPAPPGARPPHLGIINPLEGLIRTEDQPCHIASDVLKPLIAAKQITILRHPLLYRRRDPYDRQHVCSLL